MVYYWSLSDSKFPQVSKTLISIEADFDKPIGWMVSSNSLIFKCFSSYTNP